MIHSERGGNPADPARRDLIEEFSQLEQVTPDRANALERALRHYQPYVEALEMTLRETVAAGGLKPLAQMEGFSTQVLVRLLAKNELNYRMNHPGEE